MGHDQNRVIAFHRWLEGKGNDVIVVATLAETTWYNYAIRFPYSGSWAEVFNSDVYDNWINPIVAGNGGGIAASGGPLHGFAASANIVIPANGLCSQPVRLRLVVQGFSTGLFFDFAIQSGKKPSSVPLR
jgi:1,4-alpha-glucan branching enzyme